MDYIEILQDRLDMQKQKKIIDAIEIYAKELISLRSKINSVKDDIKELKKTFKTGKQYKDYNTIVNESIKLYTEQNKTLARELQELKCSFVIKNGKRKMVKDRL